MDRRRRASPLGKTVGARIRALREEAGLTLEKLAYESELGSKGHLSEIERGLVVPTVTTLKVLADHLGVAVLDLVTFPEQDARQELVDATRGLSIATVRRVLKQVRGEQLP